MKTQLRTLVTTPLYQNVFFLHIVANAVFFFLKTLLSLSRIKFICPFSLQMLSCDIIIAIIIIIFRQ